MLEIKHERSVEAIQELVELDDLLLKSLSDFKAIEFGVQSYLADIIHHCEDDIREIIYEEIGEDIKTFMIDIQSLNDRWNGGL